MQEEWKTHPKFPNYEFSNFGQARTYYKRGQTGGLNPEPKLMKQALNGFNYPHIRLKAEDGSYKSALMHLIIADLFLPPKPTHHNGVKTVIDHIDGDRANNRADNLQWITQSENLNRSRVFKDRESETLSLVDIIQLWKLVTLGYSWSQIQRDFYPQYSYYKIQHWCSKGRALFGRYALTSSDLDLLTEILTQKVIKW